jgi:hypothetical protein
MEQRPESELLAETARQRAPTPSTGTASTDENSRRRHPAVTMSATAVMNICWSGPSRQRNLKRIRMVAGGRKEADRWQTNCNTISPSLSSLK